MDTKDETYYDGYDDGIDEGIKRGKIIERKYQEQKKVGEMKLRKRCRIAVGVGVIALASAVGIFSYKAGQKNPIITEEPGPIVPGELKLIDSIENADPKIIMAWVWHSNSGIEDSQMIDKKRKIAALYNEYQVALSDRNYGYIPNLNYDSEFDKEKTKPITHEEAVKNRKNDFIEEVKDYQSTYSSENFVDSIFKYAYINEDDRIMIPCAKELRGIEIPNDSDIRVINGQPFLYIPYDSTDKENEEALSQGK